MCGIAGFSLHPDETGIDSLDLARHLLVAIEPRGRDASGAVWTEADGQSYYHKEGVRARSYVDHLPMSPTTTTAALHTRYGTGGDPADNRNNHPFSLPGITGIHNGTLTNHRDIFRELGVDPECETDSEAIFALLAYSDLPITEALAKIKGNATVAWLETERPRSLHLARLTGRPLAAATTPAGSFIFASTPELLRLGCLNADVPLKRVWTVPEWTYLRVWRGQPQQVERFRPATVPTPLYQRWDDEGRDWRDAVPAGLGLGERF